MATATAITAALETTRRHIERVHLPSRCYILRNRATSDDAGGLSDSWRRIRDDVPCRVRPPRGQREGQVADRTAAEADAEILLPVTLPSRATGKDEPVGIEASDRIEVLTDPTRPNETATFEIIGLTDDYTEPLLIVAYARRTE